MKGQKSRERVASTTAGRMIAVCILVVGMGVRAAPGDIVTTTDNQTYRDIHVDSVVLGTDGRVTVYLRGIRNGQVLGQPFPLAADLVAKIEFRTPWDTAARPDGRPATLVLRDGRRFEDVKVESSAREGNDLVFQVRQAGVPAGGEAHPVPASYVALFDIEPMNLPGAPLPGVPGLVTEAAPGAVPAMPPEGAPAVQPPPVNPPGPTGPEGGVAAPVAPAPPAPVAGALPTPTPVENMTDLPGVVRSGGNISVKELPKDMVPTPTPYPTQPGQTPAPQPTPGESVKSAFSESPPTGPGASVAAANATKDNEWDFETDDESTFRGGGLGGGRLGVALGGYFISLGSLLIGMTIAFVAGGISLYFSARTEGTSEKGSSDLGFPKAIATAALLTIFPPAFFLLCVMYIPIFGLWAGLAVWYFSARAIIMGMLEVLEAKAAAILVWFYVYLIAGQYLAGKGLEMLH